MENMHLHDILIVKERGMYKRATTKAKRIEREHINQIRRAKPELDIAHAEFNDDGMFNDIVIVNNMWIFRFPKYDWVQEDIQQEAACLSLVRTVSNLPVPEWEIHEEGFISYRIIEGAPLSRNDLLDMSREDQAQAAEDLALFLSSLHAVEMPAMEKHRIGPSITRHSYSDWLSLYDEIRQELFPYLTSYMQDQIEHTFHPVLGDNTFMDCKESMVNGDLRAYHILYNPKSNRLSGIIDFGSAGFGDPAYDISTIINQYGEGFAALLSRHYPGINDMIDRARFWALTTELQWALGGIRTQDTSWFLVHLGSARDISPFGSPLLLTGSGDLR